MIELFYVEDTGKPLMILSHVHDCVSYIERGTSLKPQPHWSKDLIGSGSTI